MPPTANEVILEKIKNYDPHLIVDWDHERELWAIKRKASDGSIQHCFFVQNEDGSFRPLDNRVMRELYECDIWKHFKNAGEYHQFIQDKNAAVSLKAETIRQDYLNWWNREHKTEWKQAMNNAQRGVLDIPEEKEKNIFIDLKSPTLKENRE